MESVLAECARWTDLGGETIIFNTETGRYFTVNASGNLLWQACSRGDNEDQMIQALIEEFDTDLSSARNDVKRFLSSLRELKLLREHQNT